VANVFIGTLTISAFQAITRTLDTKVADILMAVPNGRPRAFRIALCREIIGLGEDGIPKKLQKSWCLLVPGTIPKARYAIQSVAIYSEDSNQKIQNRHVESALLKRANHRQKEVLKHLLIDRLIYVGNSVSVRILSNSIFQQRIV